MEDTNQEFFNTIQICKSLFTNKIKDYGCNWRIFRLSSLTDQILIKAQRVRHIQETNIQKINEGQESEFIGIFNYSIIALIQIEKGITDKIDLNLDQALELYNKKSQNAFDLMQKKNFDYGEIWKSMRVSSITDIIILKLLRIKQIEDNNGKTLVSEGIEANYIDIANYAIFSILLLKNKKNI